MESKLKLFRVLIYTGKDAAEAVAEAIVLNVDERAAGQDVLAQYNYTSNTEYWTEELKGPFKRGHTIIYRKLAKLEDK